MKKLKVLHISNVAFGLSYFLGDQINFLKSINIEATIACSKSELLDDFVNKYNIKKVEVEVTRKIDVFQDLRSIYQLYRVMRRERFDYVIGHTPKGAFLAMIASWLVGVKNRIYFRHGLVFETSTGIRLLLMTGIEKITSMLATKIVNVSESVLKVSLKSKFGSKKKNIILGKGTCNGVDIAKYSFSGNELLKDKLGIAKSNIVVGFVGRLVNDKGIEELTKAWKDLIKEYSNISLLLVGPFEERDSLSEEIVTYLRNETSVIVTDFVSNTKPFYDIIDVFILPSYREGFPTVVLEASSMEIPVITTKFTGCIDSIKDEETGLYTRLDYLDIKDKIEYYIQNPVIREKHGRNGREWILENFRQEIIWEEIKSKVYDLA
ncbi:glycosyltransferase family 4 protein [Myroides odoratimimus]|uniref:glycosyltransferase family 4 protein n=1 Tax=Myroides odoratimimus TaxID=76832 RepID=UPI001CE2311B|nr:glycosyltransferase family 4 protein [Myroides odoratimimus]MCA4806982.1 glycosyltransferase family 4 protein [Myroides odoratimimus]